MSELVQFLRHAERSGLLASEDLAQCQRQAQLAPTLDPKIMAEHLVRLGKLSRFQAKKLLAGKSAGLVLGPYEILNVLGKGGMGSVFLARDRRNRNLVALKLVTPKQLEEHPWRLIRLQREMQINRRLDYSGIARIHELNQYNDVHCLTIEYVPGIDLRHRILTEGVLDYQEAASLLAEVALSLDHAHRRGVIHADVKPSNIMILDDGRTHANGRTKLVDFGLAIDLVRPEMPELKRRISGTMSYIPPEQTTPGSFVGPAADIYALGGTLYFALTGEPPFPGGTTKEKMQRQRYEPAPSLHLLVHDIPPDLAILAKQMLAKKPENRPVSAAAVAEALKQIAAE
jgi:serine/threonine-protein kinase